MARPKLRIVPLLNTVDLAGGPINLSSGFSIRDITGLLTPKTFGMFKRTLSDEASPDLTGPFPARRKRMHQQTYERLRKEHDCVIGTLWSASERVVVNLPGPELSIRDRPRCASMPFW